MSSIFPKNLIKFFNNLEALVEKFIGPSFARKK
jgi:hypothetical protein